jgi:thiol-disulfide isomerase/thioredoxin
METLNKISKFLIGTIAVLPFWGTITLQAAQEPVRKIVMISTQNCPGCKALSPKLQQVAQKSQGKIIIEVKLYDQAKDFLTKHAIGHVDLVPYLCVLVDDRLIQTFPASTCAGFTTAQQIWDALDKTALRL